MMAASGVLGEYKGSQAREVLITLKEYKAIHSKMEADAKAGYKDLAEDEESEDQSSETTYLNEGQKEYAAVDSEDD